MDRVALGAAVVWLCGSMAAAQSGGGGPPPAKVRLDAVRMENVEQRRDVTGEIRAVQRSRVAAEEAGMVVTLTLEPGDQVMSGQVIATLDDTLMVLEISQREADVASSLALVKEREAMVKKAERDLSRLKELMSGQGASQNEVDDAGTALAAASARLANSKAELAANEAELTWTRQRKEDMTIRAPFDGRVVSKGTEVGQWVRAGDTVAEIVATGEVDAWVDVPERYLGKLTTADARVQLYIAALDRTIESPISAVISDGDRLARTFPVRMRLENADGLIRPGMSVVGKVPTGSMMQAITVHKDSILRNDTGAYVYFDEGGKAMIAPIEPVFGFGDRMVVSSPTLKSGMRVVTEGNERIYFPGQPLLDVDAPAGAGAAAPVPEAPKDAVPKPAGEGAH